MGQLPSDQFHNCASPKVSRSPFTIICLTKTCSTIAVEELLILVLDLEIYVYISWNYRNEIWCSFVSLSLNSQTDIYSWVLIQYLKLFSSSLFFQLSLLQSHVYSTYSPSQSHTNSVHLLPFSVKFRSCPCPIRKMVKILSQLHWRKTFDTYNLYSDQCNTICLVRLF